MLSDEVDASQLLMGWLSSVSIRVRVTLPPEPAQP